MGKHGMSVTQQTARITRAPDRSAHSTACSALCFVVFQFAATLSQSARTCGGHSVWHNRLITCGGVNDAPPPCSATAPLYSSGRSKVAHSDMTWHRRYSQGSDSTRREPSRCPAPGLVCDTSRGKYAGQWNGGQISPVSSHAFLPFTSPLLQLLRATILLLLFTLPGRRAHRFCPLFALGHARQATCEMHASYSNAQNSIPGADTLKNDSERSRAKEQQH